MARARVPSGSGGSFSVSGTRPSSITFKIDGLANTPGLGTRRSRLARQHSGVSDPEQRVLRGVEGTVRSTCNQAGRRASAASSTSSSRTRRCSRPSGAGPQTRLRFKPVRCNARRAGLGVAARFLRFVSGGGVTTPQCQPDVRSAGAFRTGDFSSALGACAVGGGVTDPAARTDGNPTGDACASARSSIDHDDCESRFNPAEARSPFNPQSFRQPFAGNRIPRARSADRAGAHDGPPVCRIQTLCRAQQLTPARPARSSITTSTAVRGTTHFDRQTIGLRTSGLPGQRPHQSAADSVPEQEPEGKGRVFPATWARVLAAFRRSTSSGSFTCAGSTATPSTRSIRRSSSSRTPPQTLPGSFSAPEISLRRILRVDHHRDAGHLPVVSTSP